MSTETCRLCLSQPAIKNSHVIPAFVFRAIKSDSPTGFFRNPNDPNRRLQDGDTLPLLCPSCEGRFSGPENEFASRIFSSFQGADEIQFTYGPWLHYFMTSLAWRTLILDLPGMESDTTYPRQVIADLSTEASRMQQYLLGANGLGHLLRNHAAVFSTATVASPQLAAIGPNVMIRRSAFGYTLVNKTAGRAAVIHNLAGFICVLVIKGAPRDVWYNTKILPENGELKQPQKVRSWIMGHFMETLIEAHGNQEAGLSDRQRSRIAQAMNNNPKAASLRFMRIDSNLTSRT